MLTVEDIKKMLVGQLRDELKLRGASTSGKKAELYSRLEELILQELTSPSNEELPEDNGPREEIIVSNDSNKTEPVLPSESVTTVNEDSTCVVTAHDEVQSAGMKDVDGDLTLKEKLRKKLQVETAVLEQKLQQKQIPQPIAEEDNNLSTVTDPAATTHVRIDNFQRPLNLPALISWIASTCNCELSTSSIWVNGIKTHCYIDFHDTLQAQRCVERVTGQRFPSTSSKILEASYTTVAVEEAPHSSEAAQKPGEWKRSVHSMKEKRADKKRSRTDRDGHDNDDVEEEIGASRDNNNQSSQSIVKSPRILASGSNDLFFRRATAGMLLGQRSNMTAIKSSTTTTACSASTSTSSSRIRVPTGANMVDSVVDTTSIRGSMVESSASDMNLSAGPSSHDSSSSSSSCVNAAAVMSRSSGNIEASEPPTVIGSTARNHPKNSEMEDNEGSESIPAAATGKTLDDLFRKTAAKPSLYWLPAPDDIVQQRLKNKLMLKGKK